MAAANVVNNLPALLLAGICVAAGAGCFARKYRDNPRLATVAGDPIVQIAPAETLPSVDRATMVPLSRHTRRPDEDEVVRHHGNAGDAVPLVDEGLLGEAVPLAPSDTGLRHDYAKALAWDETIPMVATTDLETVKTARAVKPKPK